MTQQPQDTTLGQPSGGTEPVEVETVPDEPAPGTTRTEEDALLAAVELADARLMDLHRERAEFVNYRRRTERDVAQATMAGTAALLEALLPVLDEVNLARQHGDLEGTPFAPIADKLFTTVGRFGLEIFGEPGDPFDPEIHEALVQDTAEVETPTATRILQPGYRIGERVLRPARVAVADPG